MRLLRTAQALAVLALVAVLATPAAAIDLDSARAQGLVGETQSGYVAPVKSPSREVENLINKVNAKRRDYYRNIAQRNGVGVEEVGRMTAQKLINGLPGGAYYQAADGNWRRK